MKNLILLTGFLLLLLTTLLSPLSLSAADLPDGRYLYVAAPGIRNYLEYGGHGLLVFDIENDYKFVKRIPTAGLDVTGKPINVKGVCASAVNGRIYISTIKQLQCLDLASEKILWERTYPFGLDRMSMDTAGKFIYQPSFENNYWYVLHPVTGDEIARVTPKNGAHNTIVSLDGKEAYLAGLRSPLLTVVDTSDHKTTRTVGPFAASIRPFTVNGDRSLVYVCINNLLGFEIGDLRSGKKLHRVEVNGFEEGKVKRHGCPSHGVGLTPDETEVWVVDAHNQRLHVFDNTKMPPRQLTSIKVRDEPGWVTFRLDGKHAWPATGDIVDVKTRKIVAQLTDETGAPVMSEKMVEIHFKDGKVVTTGDQFGLGRVQ
jgi:DNA-binding beta-propeller fold protein YncE